MKTVKQPAEVLFKSLDFTDKVVMLPLMDKLSHALSSTGDLELRTDNACDILIEKQHVKKMFKVLSDLGCRTSLGESYEDIVKSDNSQVKKCFLTLKDIGENKRKIINLLENGLPTSENDATALVKCCPIEIELHNYWKNEAQYQNLFTELKRFGATIDIKIKEQ